MNEKIYKELNDSIVIIKIIAPFII